MKILVTGASGLLGAHVAAAFAPGHEVIGVDRNEWWGDKPLTLLRGDLSNPGFLDDCVGGSEPDVVVHCAAMIDVDGCEADPARAYAMNAALTGRLARLVPKSCLFVYVTTDGIFRGDTPWATAAQLPCPRTVYGRSKLHGEWEVQLATARHLIVRTNFFGWSRGARKSSGEWLYSSLESKQPIRLFDDFFFTPIYVVDFVDRLQGLIAGNHRGIFHLGGKDRVSKYEFGAMLAEEAGFSMTSVTHGSIGGARFRAPRPPDMSLSSDEFVRVTGIPLPSCREGLRRFVGDRTRPLSARVPA